MHQPRDPMKAKPSIRFWVHALLMVLTVAGTLTATVFWLRGESFDQNKWLEAAKNANIHRNEMADDLLRKFKLVGMGKEQIDSLLGTPTETDYFSTTCDYVYWLGPERGLIRIDSEWLCLQFDGRKVASAGIVRD